MYKKILYCVCFKKPKLNFCTELTKPLQTLLPIQQQNYNDGSVKPTLKYTIVFVCTNNIFANCRKKRIPGQSNLLSWMIYLVSYILSYKLFLF